MNRDALWGCLAHLGCPPKFVSATRQLHKNIKECVLHGGDQSEPFNINTGMKQGCVIAPTLLPIFLAAFLSQAKNDLAKGVNITYRTDGGKFKLSHLGAKSKVKTVTVVDLQYTDDCAVVDHSAQDLQNTFDALVDAYKLFRLSVNATKTKILHQLAQSSATTPPPNIIIVEGTAFDNVDHFVYLGSNLSSPANIDAEIQYRIKCACAAYGRLKSHIYTERGLRTSIKILVYKCCPRFCMAAKHG